MKRHIGKEHWHWHWRLHFGPRIRIPTACSVKLSKMQYFRYDAE